MAENFKFERMEKKFRMSEIQYQALIPLFDTYMQHDNFGTVIVCNIYYDTKDYTLIRESIERPPFKEKLRIRSYDIPQNNDMVFVEIKRKLNGIGYKRRISVPFADAKKLLNGERIHCSIPQIEEEILAFVRRYHPKPKVYLTYERYAMTAKNDPEFRITIDRNLKFRLSNPDTPDDTDMNPLIDGEDFFLMEIKALGAIPKWLSDELSRLHIYQAPFSKIGYCYTNHIASNCFYGNTNR